MLVTNQCNTSVITSLCIQESHCVYVKVVTQSRELCLIYMYDTQGCTAPKGECIYIRQSISACVITNMLHFQHYKNLPKPKFNCSASLYSNRHWQGLWELFFNIFIKFPNVSMMYPIAVITIMEFYSHWYGICCEVFIAISSEEFCLNVSTCVCYIHK